MRVLLLFGLKQQKMWFEPKVAMTSPTLIILLSLGVQTGFVFACNAKVVNSPPSERIVNKRILRMLFVLVRPASYRATVIVLVSSSGESQYIDHSIVYRKICRRTLRWKSRYEKKAGEKEIIFWRPFRVVLLFVSLHSIRHSISGAMNQKKETQSIAAGRRNSWCVIDRNGIIGARFSWGTTMRASIDKGLRETQVTPVGVSSSHFRQWKRSANTWEHNVG